MNGSIIFFSLCTYYECMNYGGPYKRQTHIGKKLEFPAVTNLENFIFSPPFP